MSSSFDDPEFWLPPQFLDDDDVFLENKKTNHTSFSPFHFNSSPVESVLGSIESSESEEDDIFIAGLTQKLAHSTLQHEFPAKGWGISTSPQSTLCGSRCGCESRSRGDGATWDLLYAAAAEVARLRLNQQLSGGCCTRINNHSQNAYFAPHTKHSPVSPPHSNTNNTHSHLALFQSLQASQFNHLRQQQMMKHSPHNRLSKPAAPRNQNGSHLVWPPLSQAKTQPGSGMRAVFLGNQQTKRECAGTGVFLPRVPTQPRQKQPCSTTVLMPAKVMHALNFNMNDVGPTHVPFPHNHTRKFDNAAEKQQQRVMKPQQAINLPSEWTY